MSFLPSLRFKSKASIDQAKLPEREPRKGSTTSSNQRRQHQKADLYVHGNSMPTSDLPTSANFSSAHLTLGGGVAIFHLASARVVLCYHSKDRYHFLPKGRKDVNEAPTRGAEREGYEESGYRNRLLPIPLPHRQPQPHHDEPSVDHSYATEAIWVQLAPVTRSAQYLLFWYVAETIPPSMEVELNTRATKSGGLYESPPLFERGLTIKQRIEMEQIDYEPVRHENTGVDEDEALYLSSLVPIDEAISKLDPRSISADVVRKGWQAILKRREKEESLENGTPSI